MKGKVWILVQQLPKRKP